MELTNENNDVSSPSSPPPPSPQSVKVQHLPNLADVITRNNKMMQHAGSCDELNIQRDQQVFFFNLS